MDVPRRPRIEEILPLMSRPEHMFDDELAIEMQKCISMLEKSKESYHCRLFQWIQHYLERYFAFPWVSYGGHSLAEMRLSLVETSIHLE